MSRAFNRGKQSISFSRICQTNKSSIRSGCDRTSRRSMRIWRVRSRPSGLPSRATCPTRKRSCPLTLRICVLANRFSISLSQACHMELPLLNSRLSMCSRSNSLTNSTIQILITWKKERSRLNPRHFYIHQLDKLVKPISLCVSLLPTLSCNFN